MTSPCSRYLVSRVLQELGGGQSGHAGPDDGDAVRSVAVGEAGLGRVQQLVVVFVLQTLSQMFPQAGSAEAELQREQQHTDSSWKHKERRVTAEGR